MTAPVWTPPIDWSNGYTFTQARTQAFLADNHQTGPQAATITALTALFGPEGPGAGARASLKVQQSLEPYSYLALVYDGTSWKSDEETACVLTTNTTATGATYVIAQRGALIPWKMWTDAGLTLQTQVIASITGSGGNQMRASALATTGNASGALTDDTTNESSTAVTTSNTNVVIKANWTDVNVSITITDFIALNLAIKNAAGNAAGSLRVNSSLRLRWRS